MECFTSCLHLCLEMEAAHGALEEFKVPPDGGEGGLVCDVTHVEDFWEPVAPDGVRRSSCWWRGDEIQGE